MKPIEGTELVGLLAQASQLLLLERRTGAAGMIKDILVRHEGLVEARKKLAGELKKLDDKIDKSKARIDKIAGGDWSVLSDEAKKDEAQA